jgi:hypothetical protein
MITLTISEDTAQLLRGLLLNHQDYLNQQAYGEPWEPEEREEVESLLAMLEPKQAETTKHVCPECGEPYEVFYKCEDGSIACEACYNTGAKR